MTFQVEITPVAEAQVELAYRWLRNRNPALADQWFRGLMDAIAKLQEKPNRCALAVEHKIFSEDVRQLLYGKSKSVYRILFAVRQTTVYILYVRHSAQPPMTKDDLKG